MPVHERHAGREVNDGIVEPPIAPRAELSSSTRDGNPARLLTDEMEHRGVSEDAPKHSG